MGVHVNDGVPYKRIVLQTQLHNPPVQLSSRASQPQLRVSLENRRISQPLRLDWGTHEHVDEQRDGIFRGRAPGKPSDHGVPTEEIGPSGPAEEPPGVVDVAGRGGAEGQRAARGEGAAREAGLDELSVEDPEVPHGGAALVQQGEVVVRVRDEDGRGG